MCLPWLVVDKVCGGLNRVVDVCKSVNDHYLLQEVGKVLVTLVPNPAELSVSVHHVSMASLAVTSISPVAVAISACTKTVAAQKSRRPTSFLC